MIDLERLEALREEAATDKADLFDFYNTHWDKLIAELRQLRQKPTGVPGHMIYGQPKQ